MTRTRAILAGAVAAIAATAALLGGILGETAAKAPPAGPVRISADQALAGFSAGDTDQNVRALQARLRERPRDARSNALLGLAYQQRARETGDPSFYPLAAGVLRRALVLAPRNELALSARASLSLSQHRFREALQVARRAQALAPYAARNYGFVGDALVELGRYPEGFRAFDRMSRLKPNLSAYARVSYGRELLGQRRGAIEAMKLAAAAGGSAEPEAWARVQLAELYLGGGRVEAARRELRRALFVFPGYVAAVDALARVEAARGRPQRAIELARQAAETVPLPEFVATLGDLYWMTGRREAAREQYALIGATERLLRANGVKTDLETARFKVDHGIELAAALRLARAAHRDRPTVFASDTLAWALVRNGRCGEAVGHSQQALRLGTKDASFFFHRGMIERCLGHRAAAREWFSRALQQNPHFSPIWAPVARKAVT